MCTGLPWFLGGFGDCGGGTEIREAIPAPGDGLDVLAAARSLPERLPKHGDRDRQVVLLDGGAWPHAPEQLLLEEEVALVLDQDLQQVEGLGGERNDFAVAITESTARDVAYWNVWCNTSSSVDTSHP